MKHTHTCTIYRGAYKQKKKQIVLLHLRYLLANLSINNNNWMIKQLNSLILFCSKLVLPKCNQNFFFYYFRI